jgi:hypothetical protein
VSNYSVEWINLKKAMLTSLLLKLLHWSANIAQTAPLVCKNSSNCSSSEQTVLNLLYQSTNIAQTAPPLPVNKHFSNYNPLVSLWTYSTSHLYCIFPLECVHCTMYIWSGRLQSTCRDQVIFIGWGGVEGGGCYQHHLLDLSKLLTLLRGAFI